MKRLLKIGAVLLILLLVTGGLLLASLGKLVQTGIVHIGSAMTGVEVSLADASVSPFSGRGVLRGLVVGNPDGYVSRSAIEADAVEIELAPRSLLADKVVIHAIRIRQPEITFEGVPGENNLTRLLAHLRAFQARTEGDSTNSPAGPQPGRRLQVDEFLITGARLRLQTPFTGADPLSLDVEDLRLTDLGQGSEGITAAELGQRILTALLGSTTNRVSNAFLDIGNRVLEETHKRAHPPNARPPEFPNARPPSRPPRQP
jgi:hypothetical protein